MDLGDIAAGPAKADGGSELRLPGYCLVGLLRTSGQGRVFQAVRLADARKVAIKFIRPDRLADSTARARFQQEARTLALLNHPGIVRIVESGEFDDGQLWFAAEYIPGLPLNEYVNKLDQRAIEAMDENGFSSERQTHPRLAVPQKRGDFPLREVLEIFMQICDAVQAAHNVGVLHRDLKPSNIIVDDEGRPHVLDFGLAKTPDVTDPALVTLTGQFLGSPAWCSPEQVEARPSAIDVRSDVYSLGVILYNLLTGTFPYPVDRPLAEVFDAIRHGEPTRPSAHAAFIDDDLETTILKAIAKEKDRRYQSAGELRDEVQRYLRGEPIRAKGDGRLYVTGKFLRRHPVVTGVAAAAFILSLAYGGAVTVLYRRAILAETKATANAEDARVKFRMARETADFMISEIDEKLKHVAGAGGLREDLLERAYDQLQTLTKEDTNDPALRADLADAHKKLSDIALGLGRVDDAAVHRNRNLEIYEGLAAAFPENLAYQERLSIALVLVGDVLKASGDVETAEGLYERALKIDEMLVALEPNNADFADSLGFSYERLGQVAFNRSDYSRCQNLWNSRHEIAERLVAGNPDAPAHLWGLYHSLQALAILEERTGGGAPSMELERRCTELAAQLFKLEPTNTRYAEIMVRQYWRRADVAESPQECEESMLEALEVARHISDREPNSPLSRQLLAHTHMRLAKCAVDRGDFDVATDHFLQAQELAKDESWPTFDYADRELLLLKSHLGLAEAAAREGRPAASALHRDAALTVAQRVSKLAGVNGRTLSAMAEALGRTHVRDDRMIALALAAAEQSVIVTRGRDVWCLDRLAQTRYAAGDRNGAVEAIQSALSQLPFGPSRVRSDFEQCLARFLSDSGGVSQAPGGQGE